MVGVRDVTGDTSGDIETYWLSLYINGDMVGDINGDTKVTLVTFFNVTTCFCVTTGVTMLLGDTSGEILVLAPKNAERRPPYPGP